MIAKNHGSNILNEKIWNPKISFIIGNFQKNI